MYFCTFILLLYENDIAFVNIIFIYFPLQEVQHCIMLIMTKIYDEFIFIDMRPEEHKFLFCSHLEATWNSRQAIASLKSQGNF